MSTLLIDKLDFASYRQISNTRDVTGIELFIKQAQNIDLKPLMCDAFYFDLMSNFQADEYQKFIHGETYEDAKGNTVEFEGLKPVIVHFANARYVLRGGAVDTAFGIVQKTNEQSQPLSATEKRDMSTQDKQDANTYWLECVRYLDTKIEDFPKWKECCGCEEKTKSNYKKIDTI